MPEYIQENYPPCPVCYASSTVEITEGEKVEALALWDLYDFVGRLDVMSQQFRCTQCGHQW